MTKAICHTTSMKSDFLSWFVQEYEDILDPNWMIVDLGAGKHRNAIFLKWLGFQRIICFDRYNYGKIRNEYIDFETEEIELSKSPDLILCNHVIQFIDNREFFLSQINFISSSGTLLIFEFDNRVTLGADVDHEMIETFFLNHNWEILKFKKKRRARTNIKKDYCSFLFKKKRC